jgi:hypothetical protein
VRPSPDRRPLDPRVAFQSDLDRFLARHRKPGCTAEVAYSYAPDGRFRKVKIVLEGPWQPDAEPEAPPDAPAPAP